MNRKISMVLTLSMLVNVLAYAGSLAFAESSEVVDGQSNLVAEEIISSDNLKREDVSTSLAKDNKDTVANSAVQLENLADVKSKIGADAKVAIELPTKIQLGQSVISGKLVRGIGVSV